MELASALREFGRRFRSARRAPDRAIACEENPELLGIAPYETDPRKWEAMRWIDPYSKDGKRYRISASALHGSQPIARVPSYGDVLRACELHPEAKCADAGGAPCGKRTVGLLGRRHVAIDAFTYIGKESNKLEEFEEQSLLDPTDVYTKYPDAGRDEWKIAILPISKPCQWRN